MSKKLLAKAGMLLCVDSGQYSDYSVVGFFVVLRDFDPMAELAAYLDAHPEQRVRYRFDSRAYFAVLVAKELLMEVKCGTLYLGAYSCDEVSFAPAPIEGR